MAHFAAVFSFSFLECRNEAVGEVIVDILADVVALEDLDELLVGRVVLILFAGCDDIDVWGRVIFSSQCFLGVQVCGLRIACVDDGNRYIIEGTRELGSFEFDDFQFLWIFSDIIDRCLCRIGARFQLQETVVVQKEQSASAIGRIVRDGNLCAVRNVFDAGDLIGINAERCEVCISDGNKVGPVLFIKSLQERAVLERVQIDVAGSQSLVRGDIVRERLDIDSQTLLSSFLGCIFHDLFRIARCNTYGNFIFHSSRRSSRLLVAAAAGNDTGKGNRCQGKSNGSF